MPMSASGRPTRCRGHPFDVAAAWNRTEFGWLRGSLPLTAGSFPESVDRRFRRRPLGVGSTRIRLGRSHQSLALN